MASSSVTPTPLLQPATGRTEVAQGQATLDAHKLRADFPIFEQRFHGKPLAYLDSAVSAQKPRQVLDAQREFHETSYTNVHRGVYLLAERATGRFSSVPSKLSPQRPHEVRTGWRFRRSTSSSTLTGTIVVRRASGECSRRVISASCAPAEEVFSCPDEADLPSSFSLRTDATSARVPPSTISMC